MPKLPQTESRPLYLVDHLIESPTPNWHQQYLINREARVTHILRDSLGNPFWEQYAKALISSVQQGHLLLRVKSLRGTSVSLAQVWISEPYERKFVRSACGGISIPQLLTEKGYTVNRVETYLTEHEFRSYLADFQNQPHILQFVNEAWRQPWMHLGDPIKEGKGYLPFPDK